MASRPRRASSAGQVLVERRSARRGQEIAQAPARRRVRGVQGLPPGVCSLRRMYAYVHTLFQRQSGAPNVFGPCYGVRLESHLKPPHHTTPTSGANPQLVTQSTAASPGCWLLRSSARPAKGRVSAPLRPDSWVGVLEAGGQRRLPQNPVKIPYRGAAEQQPSPDRARFLARDAQAAQQDDKDQHRADQLGDGVERAHRAPFRAARVGERLLQLGKAPLPATNRQMNRPPMGRSRFRCRIVEEIEQGHANGLNSATGCPRGRRQSR